MSNLIPDGWAEHRQGDIADFSNGKAYKLTEWEKTGTPVIRLQNLTGSGKNFYYSNLRLPDRQYCESGDLLYMWSATFGPHIWRGPKAIYHYHIWKVTCNETDLTKPYLYQLLGYKTAEWLNQSNGMGILHITKGGMEELKLILPPLPDQQKIAAILSSVDNVIEKTQAQIDKLKDLKTGMMQELLMRGVGVDGKPHTEFKDSPVGRIPKGWDVVKLSEVLTKIDSGWSPACIEVPPQTGEWGVLKVSSVTRGEFLETQSKTLPSNLEPKVHIKVKNGDLLLTRANGVADLVGKCVMIQSEPRSKLMMSDKILRLNPNERIYSHFLLHAFNSQEMRRQIEFSWGGSSGQKNISQTDIKNYYLALPSFDEQKVIGDSISQIDRVLSAKKNKLVKMNNTKKALMQDLLTGKVRVKVDS